MPYRMLYRVKTNDDGTLIITTEAHPDGISRAEVAAIGDAGACDAVIVASIIYPENGSLSTAWIFHDGRTNAELAPIEVFKAWTMLAKHLADQPELPQGHREVAEMVFRAVQGSVLKARGLVGPPDAAETIAAQDEEINDCHALIAKLTAVLDVATGNCPPDVALNITDPIAMVVLQEAHAAATAFHRDPDERGGGENEESGGPT